MTQRSPTGSPVSIVYETPTATGGSPPVVIACAPQSGSTFPIGVTAVSCTATDQTQKVDSCAFTVTVTAPPTITATRFIAYGDSITWGEDGTNFFDGLGMHGTLGSRPLVQLPFLNTYPGALQNLLALRYTAQTVSMVNAGKPLEKANDPASFDRFRRAVTSGQYDVVLLMEGANDLPDVTGAVGAIQVMVQTVKNQGRRVFLATIPPESIGGSRGANANSVPAYNDGIRGVAASLNVPLVDVFQAFGGDLTLLGADGLHPNAQGYQRIAETFLAVIKQNLEVAQTTLSTPSTLLRRR